MTLAPSPVLDHNQAQLVLLFLPLCLNRTTGVVKIARASPLALSSTRIDFRGVLLSDIEPAGGEPTGGPKTSTREGQHSVGDLRTNRTLRKAATRTQCPSRQTAILKPL